MSGNFEGTILNYEVGMKFEFKCTRKIEREGL